MKINLDTLAMRFVCDNCNEEFEKTYGQVKDGQTFQCPHCRKTLTHAGERQAETLRRANALLEPYLPEEKPLH